MAKRFTREAIREILGDAHTDDIENALVALHIGVVDQIKTERDQYKAQAEQLESVQKELDTLKSGTDYKALYEQEHRAFEEHKAQAAEEARASQVRAAYKKLLQDCNVGEKYIDAVCRASDLSGRKLTEGGTFEDEAGLREAIQNQWGAFIESTAERGQKVETPPRSGGAGMTKAEILAIQDTSARQKAIAENLQLFTH